MSLEKIHLPDFLFADLYRNNLVAIADKNAPKSKPTPIIETPANITFQPTSEKLFLGDNNKKITILIKDAEAVFLRDEWLTTLGKLLQALKMNLSDVAIINLQHQQISFEKIKTTLQAKYLFLFNVSTTEIGLPFIIPEYQIQPFDGCTILMASAETLSSNKTSEAIKLAKTKLWVSLKNIFAI